MGEERSLNETYKKNKKSDDVKEPGKVRHGLDQAFYY